MIAGVVGLLITIWQWAVGPVDHARRKSWSTIGVSPIRVSAKRASIETLQATESRGGR